MIHLSLHYLHSDNDTCLDTSICREGLKINTEYGKIIINKASCLKYGWRWIENSNACYLYPIK